MATTRLQAGLTNVQPAPANSSGSAGRGKRVREASSDDGGDEPPLPKRARLESFDNTKHAKILLVVANWRRLAPATNDNRRPIDRIAESIIPGSDLNCAAVRILLGRPLVGMNTWVGTAVEGSGNRQPVYRAGAYDRARDSTIGVHAEMRILQHSTAWAPIGISKRCCLRCAVVMNIMGFGNQIRGNSGEIYDTGWTIPSFFRNNQASMAQFLSQPVFDWLAPYSPAQKDEFYRLLETVPSNIGR